jgi:2-oxoglutarate ferredoxin oxidoreductase subunit gamma
MNQAACDAYYRDLPAGGLLVVDSYLVEQLPTSRIVAIPFTQIAKEKFGSALVANMIALGMVGSLSRQVNPESLKKALLARVPAGTSALNLEALQLGMDEAAKINLDALPRSLQNDDEV